MRFKYLPFQANFHITSLWLKKGSLFDPSRKEGLAHLCEHLFLRRIPKYKKYEKLMAFINEQYLNYGAYTDKEYTFFYFIHPQNKRKVARYLLEECSKSIDLDSEDIVNEKKVILNEQAQAERNDTIILNRLSDQAIWHGTPCAHEILGTKKSIDKITLDDVLKFKTQSEYDARLLFKPPKNIIKETDSGLIHVAVTLPFFRVHNPLEVVGLDLLVNYLAGGWASVLVKKLRVEHSYTYWVTGIAKFLSSTGYLRIFYSTSLSFLEPSLHQVIEEVSLLKKKNIDTLMLEKQKEIFVHRLLEKLSNPHAYVKMFGLRQIYFNYSSIKDYLVCIRRLDTDLIRTIANKHLTTCALVVIGRGASQVKL